MIGLFLLYFVVMFVDVFYIVLVFMFLQFVQGWLCDVFVDLLVEIVFIVCLVIYFDGECIYLYGGLVQGMFLIVCGCVCISWMMDGGSEFVYGVLCVGEWFGEIVFIDGGGCMYSVYV